MWSVTEQNHLHYSAVMFHHSGLAHRWSPSSLTLPLFVHLSVPVSSAKCPAMGHSLPSSQMITRLFQLPSIFFSFHLSLQCQSFIASSFFWGYLHSYLSLLFCFALRFCHLSALGGLAALVLFVHLHDFVGPQLLSAIFSFRRHIFFSLCGILNFFSAVFQASELNQAKSVGCPWYLEKKNV